MSFTAPKGFPSQKALDCRCCTPALQRRITQYSPFGHPICDSCRFQAEHVRGTEWRIGTAMAAGLHAMLAGGTHYRDRTVDYEALVVQRNALRWVKMLAKHGYLPATA